MTTQHERALMALETYEPYIIAAREYRLRMENLYREARTHGISYDTLTRYVPYPCDAMSRANIYYTDDRGGAKCGQTPE